MKKIGKIVRRIYWCITILLLALSITVATYAWFTSNHTVTTDTATARSGTENLSLQISGQGGEDFKSSDNVAIVQVNQTTADALLPVSTANLSDFVYNPVTEENKANRFRLVEQENNYYHGRIFLRADAQGMAEGTRMALYLDETEQTGGVVLQSTKGKLADAARLGLVLDGDSSNPIIFRFTDEYSTYGTETNTYLNGKELSVGQVLGWRDSTPVAETDPSTTLEQYTVKQPLMYMNYNQIYQVDIYFYIEGCDPDSTEEIYGAKANLHLGFYGVVVEE